MASITSLFSSDNLRRDLPASLVVFCVAVPLCLGIALASGAPLISGIVAGIVGGIVVGSISGSSLGVSGPAAGLAVVVLTAIGTLGSFEAFLVAVVLGGLLQIGFGLARAGVLAFFFPASVIRGMLAGIGVLIVLKQIPHAVGHDSTPEGQLGFVQADGDNTLSALGHLVDTLSVSAMLVAAIALTILLVWELFLNKRGGVFQLLQGPVVAVAFGIVFQAVALAVAPNLALEPSHLVNLPVADSAMALVASLHGPDWSALSNPAVWTTALTLAIVASLETLLCVEATDKLDPEQRVTPPNRELLAQGVGNAVSGLFGGLPVTQVIVRSSANVQSGARTKVSAIAHGVLIFAFVLWLPQLLNMIPLAALAAVLIVVGYKLAKPALFAEMYRRGPAQFLPFVATVGGIVFTDLLMGIGLGMAVAIAVILRAHYLNSHFLHLVREGEGDSRRVSITLAEEVTFLNRAALLKELEGIRDNAKVRIDARATVFLDDDIRDLIEAFAAKAARRGITVEYLAPRERSTVPPQAPSDRMVTGPLPTVGSDASPA